MHRDVIADMGVTHLPEIALTIFVWVFVLIIIRAAFMKKDRVDHMERLPLDDGQRSES